MDSLSLSVVVPLLDEEANVAELVEAVRSALSDQDAWELILVDDGSSDRTPEIAERLAREDPRVRLIRLARRYGQSTAMQAGFDHVRGRIVVTMDGDLQNDPRDIPVVVGKLQEGYDLVAGYRLRRKDPLFTRKVPSWVANRIIRWVTGVEIRDNGCSLKAYDGRLIARMRLYSDMHRFIPALAAGTAGARIAEVPVRHHPRRRGSSKYGLSRVFRVLADLVTIKMIRSFRLRPLLLFGVLAGVAGALGVVSAVATGVAVTTFRPTKAVSLVFPGVTLLWFALSTYLIMLGLVGEVAVRDHRRRRDGILPIMRSGSP